MGYQIQFLLTVFEDLLFFYKLDWIQLSYTLSVLIKFSILVSSNYLAPTLQINTCHFSPTACPRATENTNLPAQTLTGMLGCLVSKAAQQVEAAGWAAFVPAAAAGWACQEVHEETGFLHALPQKK